MKRLLAAALLACATLPALANYATLPEHVRGNLPVVAKHPKAASILLWVRDSYSLHADGSQVYERHEFRYLPDEAAREVWGDPHIAFADDRQRLDVIAARAYTKDGRTVDATPNALNPITPEALDSAPDYEHFKQLVVSLLGLENGSVAELHYTLTTRQPLFSWLWGRVYLREEVPVAARELVVRLPEGQALNYQVFGGAPEPAISGSAYTWRTGGLPGYLAEDLNGRRTLLPNVAFTTVKHTGRAAQDWEPVVAEFRRRVNASTDVTELPASLQRKLAGTREPESRLDSIQAWMRERFNEVQFDHPDFLLSVRPASQVLHSGYGHSVELAILVANLCNRAGVTNPAGIAVVPEVWFADHPPVPSLHELSGGLVSAITDVEQIECHPLTPRTESPDGQLADATILVLGPDSILYSLPPSVADDMPGGEFRINFTIDALDADTLRGTGTLFAKGWMTPYTALRSDPQGYFAHLIGWNTATVEQAVVKALDWRWASATFAFTIPAPEAVDNDRVLAMSVVNLLPFVDSPGLSLDRREFPHYLKRTGTVSVHVETPVPSGWTVTRRPGDVTREWKDGSGTRTVEVRDGRVILDEKLALGGRWVPAQDWSAFRTFLLETGSRPNNILVFSDKAN